MLSFLKQKGEKYKFIEVLNQFFLVYAWLMQMIVLLTCTILEDRSVLKQQLLRIRAFDSEKWIK